MNLETKYLGLTLRNPLVVGASPFCDNLDASKRLEEAGASAIVMHSLFEEQIDLEQQALIHHMETSAESNFEATSYFPHYDDYQLTPDTYLRALVRLKSGLSIPVIASLNGRRLGGWVDYARQLESAGADALELNTYQLATDPDVSGEDIETEIRSIVRAVSEAVRIPVSVKLSPFHASLAHFAASLEQQGAEGLVLFNRFFQPDFDIDELEVVPRLKLSYSSELLLRLRWLSILSPKLKGSLACSGGVHTPDDLIKSILGGAHAVQIVSVLLEHGPRTIPVLLDGLTGWMSEHGHEDLSTMRGALNLKRCPDAAAHERANYIKILQSWKI
ncbi:MAG: dihydroorotate dehydrogenase-like protein [Opitutus sp.]|nr:dihydroorotate dehydrogenase-like protein [Opitutus sp.]MCS6248332.1 dihydroorotate dehydrogenase-like protein [Opitutus sp.]MCS6273568.1 dihydroorotate dehydrogenase-like protein [Opitutus sp.]MCS6278566.1 dihydroorotate dehydrogenase-like protein [Opitutus sp.]MCS6300032.1 dihydroorotate dehydrogenase-like protein [Opitutus sp.]